MDPNTTLEPWQLTKLQYQEVHAKRAGGIPILNARDGREWEHLIDKMLTAGRQDISAEVLASCSYLLRVKHGLEPAD
jgi:hypothetical protein